jgi:hypothetical protein
MPKRRTLPSQVVAFKDRVRIADDSAKDVADMEVSYLCIITLTSILTLHDQKLPCHEGSFDCPSG